MSFTLPNTISNDSTRDARPIQANFQAISDAFNNDYLPIDGTVAMTGALVLPSAPTAALHAATKAYVDALIPVGTILDYSGAAAPGPAPGAAGHAWLLCQGQLVNKADYPTLYALLTTTYGAETGTQFRLPDLTSRFVVGKGSSGFSNVLGESGGSADAVAVAHSHAHIHGIDHNHAATSTGGVNSGHDIVHRSGTYTTGYLSGRDANNDGILDGTTNGGGMAVSNGGTAHTHSVDIPNHVGNSGQPESASQSPTSTATDKNLPPYITLNKIIRVG